MRPYARFHDIPNTRLYADIHEIVYMVADTISHAKPHTDCYTFDVAISSVSHRHQGLHMWAQDTKALEKITIPESALQR